MGALTYTKHKLNDSKLRRLNAICHGRQVGGVSMLALERRGLVTGSGSYRDGDHKWVATPAGRLALAAARRQGW